MGETAGSKVEKIIFGSPHSAIRLSKLWPKINMKSLEIDGYDDYFF